MLGMATGTRGGGDGYLDEVLDRCLDRLGNGDDLDRCLAENAGLADELEPLLRTAADVQAARVTPPPLDLGSGRERFLRAAAARRTAAAPVADAQADALDRAVAQVRSGASLADALAAVPELAPEAAPLVAMACRVVSDMRAPAPPPAGWPAARSRFLRAARAQRGRRGLDWRQRLSALVAPPRLVAVPRMAAAALVAVFFATAGGRLLMPAAAAALPGDTLYAVKLVGERIQLALAFDPDARERVVAGHSQARGRELLALHQLGRDAEIHNWRVRFKSFEDHSLAPHDPHGLLLVSAPGAEGQPVVWTLVWDAGTRFDLRGAYAQPRELPPETPLIVRVASAAGNRPRAVAVTLDDSDPLQTATPEPSATWTATTSPPPETPEGTATAAETETPEPESPTPDASAEPQASATPDIILTGKPDRDRLRGVVESVTANTDWVVRAEAPSRDGESGGRLVRVDASRLPTDTWAAVKPGDWVQMLGRYVDSEQTVFQAQALDRHVARSSAPQHARCSTNSVIGFVTGYVPVTWLALADGTRYDLTGLGAQVAPAGLQTGSRVRIEYRDCGDGRRAATALEMLDAPAETIVRGTVENAAPWRFDLVTRTGARYAVTYDVDTLLVGAGGVENGQEVQVRGWIGADVLHATEIRSRQESAEAPPAETPHPTTEAHTPPPETPAPPHEDGAGAEAAAALAAVGLVAVPARSRTAAAAAVAVLHPSP